MSAVPDLTSRNFYNVLGVAANASPKDIKRARDKLALQFHPDKQGGSETLMRVINIAYAALADPEQRRHYDLQREDDEESTHVFSLAPALTCYPKLSDTFREKLKAWSQKGPPATDKTPVSALAAGYQEPLKSHPASESYRRFLSASVPSVKEGLADAVSREAWDFSFVKRAQEMELVKLQRLVESPIWNEPLQAATDESERQKTLIDDFNALYLSSAKPEEFSPPDIAGLKKALEDVPAPGFFSSNTRRPVGREAPLCPATGFFLGELGVIPKHTIQATSPVLEKTSSCCSDCQKPFGLLLWSSHCALCGGANCEGCLKVQDVPAYTKPAPVCKNCEPELSQVKREGWLVPLATPEGRKEITPKYLALLLELGFAEAAQLNLWMTLFIKEGSPALAMTCNHLVKGSWIQLANQFAEKKDYKSAMRCLGQLKDKSSDWWAKQGDSLALNSSDVALLCYRKAGFTSSQYREKAFTFLPHLTGEKCLLMAMRTPLTSKEQSWLLEQSEKAVARGEYSLGHFWKIVRSHQKELGIYLIHQVDLKRAELLATFMGRFYAPFQSDWLHLKFHPDKDHLRWPHVGYSNFDTSLADLLSLLEIGDGKNAILYFRAWMKEINFALKRDSFFQKGDFTKAFLCNLLTPNKISWTELGEKWRHQDEAVSFSCYLNVSKNLEATGDQLFQKRDFSFALRCYLEAKAYLKIAEKAKQGDLSTRLLYQVALYKYGPNQGAILLEIAETLLLNPSQIPAVKKLLMAGLKGMKLPSTLPYHKILAKLPLTDLELLGLLAETAPFCIQGDDKKWHEENLGIIRKKFKERLRSAIYEASSSQAALIELFSLFDYIHPLTVITVKELFQELQIDNYPVGPCRSICLAIRAATIWQTPGEQKILQAMNDLSSAMLGDPREEFLQFCSKVVEKMLLQTKGSIQFRGPQVTDTAAPGKSEYTSRLQSNPLIKMLLRSEKAIAKFEPLQAAMSYIDLCKGIQNAPGMVGALLRAAFELLQVQQALAPIKKKEKYAYRRAIVELVAMACDIGKSHLCPATELYALRSGIALLTSAFKDFKTVSSEEQDFLQGLYTQMDRLSAASPIVLGHMVSVFDLIYQDVINRSFLEGFLPAQRARANRENPLYQYFIFEGTWKGWIDEEKFKFPKERENTMQALLKEKGNTAADVEELMDWPSLTQDQEGWRKREKMPLKLTGQGFSKVTGIRFNLETAEIAFLLDTSSKQMEDLFDISDVTSLLRLGVAGAQFTLDPPDPKLPDHPFQEMRYAPDCIAGTRYLATMLHADLLLKMLSMGTEISGKHPFKFRDVDEGLLQRLPADLRKKFSELRSNVPLTAGRVHRFWIEAGELPYYETREGNEITFTFGAVEMSVKKHLMRLDPDGKLIDTDKDEETDSPEAQFAKLMSDEYENLGKYFPELARLKELAKIQAMAAIAQSIFRSTQKRSESLEIDADAISSHLTKLFSQLGPRKSTSENVNAIIDQHLRKNQLLRHQIPKSQLGALTDQVKRDYEEADRQQERQLTELLCQNYHAEKSAVQEAVLSLRTQGTRADLEKLLKQSAEMYEREKILRICKTFEKMGIAKDLVSSSLVHACTWVPAAFSAKGNHKVYGGVNMNARLTAGSPPAGGGPIGGGSAGTGYRHVISMNAAGQIFGTTTCVDPVSGNTYTAQRIETCIRDQFNQSIHRGLNTTYYAETGVGYTTTRHYTNHVNGAAHVHNVSGWAKCQNKDGVVQGFKSGDKNHRCDTPGYF